MIKSYLKLPFALSIILSVFFSLPIFAQEEPEADQVPKKVPQKVKTPEEIHSEVTSDINKEEAYREKIELEAEKFVREAGMAFQKDEYSKAIKLYLEAIDKLKMCSTTSGYTKDRVKNIQQNMAVVYHYWGRETADQAEKEAEEGKFDEAITKCVTAMKIEPSLQTKMERLIKKYQRMKSNTKYKNQVTEEIVDPKKEERLYEIDVLMLQGKRLYQAEQWHRAREKFEQVLLIDPYHLKAMEEIKKLTKRMYKAGQRRFETTQEERNAEVEWNYISPLIARSLAPQEQRPEPIEREQTGTKIKDKLKSIIIDHMEFEDASISAVVNLLRVRAKDLDPQKEGINIFLRMGNNAAPAAAAPEEGLEKPAADEGLADDDFLSEDDDAGGAGDALIDDAVGESNNKEKTITIMFDDLSLGEAIRNICIAADMNYRIEEYAVVIAAKNVALDNLETRIYPVEQDAFREMGAEDGAEGSTTSVKDYFSKRGIAFPTGARIVYDGSISRLIATNTNENLRKIEQIIDELNVIDPQVLIEAKFVEIQENKTDELGFEWTVSKQSPTGVTFDANDPMLRFDNNLAQQLSGNDVAFSLEKTTNQDINIQMQIHAMDLQDRTDILSTPRITTQNGEEATIRMVTERYFPESWGESSVFTDALGTGFVASMPEFGEATELGVRMTVTPTVDPDKYTISLDLIPVVQAFAGWVDYSYTVPDGDGGTLPNTLLMPIIEARTIQTQITIYDGETVVMGGIMRDATATTDDKFPILGELPLIGRAFRSRYVDKIKANLLIFTTVRLVNPDGSPLREREVRGKPPFRM